MSKDYILNPYMPEYEYIPDGEPHVFGDRVYVYGSHDRFSGELFCMNHYVAYSAPVTDLTDWRYEGVIYRNDQDIRMQSGDRQLWAPDVVCGKDGKYYLFYCPDDSIRSIGVAVCDSPAGKYEFLGIVHDKDGNYIGEREGDTIAFDPGVFIDDDGSIYLYSGNGPRTVEAIGKLPKGSRVMKLADDMLTVIEEPKPLLPCFGDGEGTGFEGHEFFEASSIRKINGKYYLVYSSYVLHELCYAISDYPDRDYKFGGVIVSNAEIFQNSEDKTPKNMFGNNHGGIEVINGELYIFYHRQTNYHMYSRQGCAEKLKMLPDGSIEQVRLTSYGLTAHALPGKGTYPASCVCILHGDQVPDVMGYTLEGIDRIHPYLTMDWADFDLELLREAPNMQTPRQYIANGKDGLHMEFRSFDFKDTKKVFVTVRGTMDGILEIFTGDGKKAGEICLTPSERWKVFCGAAELNNGEQDLIFKYSGKGKLDFLEFTMI